MNKHCGKFINENTVETGFRQDRAYGKSYERKKSLCQKLYNTHLRNYKSQTITLFALQVDLKLH